MILQVRFPSSSTRHGPTIAAGTAHFYHKPHNQVEELPIGTDTFFLKA